MEDKRTVVIDGCCLGRRKTGNETYLRGLLQGLAELKPAGLNLVVITTPSHTGPRTSDFTWQDVPLSNFVRRNYLDIPSRLRRLNPDLYHGVYWTRFWDRQSKIVTVHDVSFVTRPAGYRSHERLVYCQLIRRSATRARHILTVSEYSKREIIEVWKLPPERITVTPLAVAPHFQPAPEGPSGEATILYVGNLHPRKNLVRLLEALVRLRQEYGADVRLKIVGQKAWLYEEIFQTVRKQALEDRVEFTGYVSTEELVHLYQTATVMVYPSLYEGFGLPVLEAMACGCPVVTSNTTSLPEVAGQAAVLVDPTSADEIAAGTWKVISSRERQAEMRKAGLAQAARFSWKRMAAGTANAYRLALA